MVFHFAIRKLCHNSSLCMRSKVYVVPVVLLVPTKTTRTAAYVAVLAIVSTLPPLNPNATTVANSKTAKHVVIRLFALVVLIAMINMGTNRNAPPMKAIKRRVARSTNGEMDSGSSPM